MKAKKFSFVGQLVFSGMVVAGILLFWSESFAQTPNARLDKPILPSLEEIDSLVQVRRLHVEVDRLEKTNLKDKGQNQKSYCDTLLNLVIFRYELHKTSFSIFSSHTFIKVSERVKFQDIIGRNVLRAGELFAKAEERCVLGDELSDIFLMAKFSNVWLLDNFQTRVIRDEHRDHVLKEYDAVLRDLRSRADKTSIDPVPILYSYANSLLRNAQFEEAEPLLSECVSTAQQRYGTNSPIILPALKHLAGIAHTAGNTEDHERFRTWISQISGASSGNGAILYNLKSRATPETINALNPKKAVVVMGKRHEVEGRLNRRFPSRDVTEDLPRPAGQPHVSNSIVGMSTDSGRPVLVALSVNESGSVTGVDVTHIDENIISKVEATALGLKFKPMIYKGRTVPMKGIVYIFVK